MRKMAEEISHDRRRFLGTAAAAMAALQLGVIGRAEAEPNKVETAGRSRVKLGKDTPFGPVKQINAGVLNVGYVEAGPADGPAVILMHGFPYDIHSYVEVAPLLAAEGYRPIVPYFRGLGTTTFLSSTTAPSAERAAFALDILALMDVLEIEQAILAGYDWGSRTGDIIAALWPERCKAVVSVTGYLITNLAANKQPLPPMAEWAWWYQYYFATERGELGLEQYRHDLGQLIWKFNSPTWDFDEATYDRSAAAFENPDYVSIVLNNYRWRLGLIDSEPRSSDLQDQLEKAPDIGVPTITLDGEYDPFTPAGNGSAYRDKFTGQYRHRTLKVGHNLPQEAPRAVAEAVVDADGL